MSENSIFTSNITNERFVEVVRQRAGNLIGAPINGMTYLELHAAMVDNGVDDALVGIHYVNGVRHTTVETVMGGIGLYLTEHGHVCTFIKKES